MKAVLVAGDVQEHRALLRHPWAKYGTPPKPMTHSELFIMLVHTHLSTLLMTPPWIRWSRRESNKISTFIFMLSQAKTWSSHWQKSLRDLHKKSLLSGQGLFMPMTISARKEELLRQKQLYRYEIDGWISSHVFYHHLLPRFFKQPYEGCRLSCCWACRWKEKWK